MLRAPLRLTLTLACSLAAPAFAQTVDSAPAPATGKVQPAARFALIYPFATATAPSPDAPTPSTAACPAAPTVAADPSTPPLIDPKLADAIVAELQKKLAKKFTVHIATPAQADTAAQHATPSALPPAQPSVVPVTAPSNAPEPRTLLFAGCITTAQPGNAAARYAGFGLGASHLSAHIVVQVQTTEGPHPLTDFIINVTGSSLLPPLGPIGLVTHAATSGKKTLTGDAKKLADEILKTFAERMKAAKQPIA
jgi:hypothetical protein